MLKKYISKFTIDILPSVLATIIGAYIVNHYIVAKPADAPVAAAVSSSNPPKADAAALPSLAAIPEAGVKAKGVSEKAILEKTAAERPTAVEKPADAASLPAEPRRHQPAAPAREKTIAKAVQAPAPAAVQTASPDAAPVEAAVAPEEKSDANELARAAIERLRHANEAAPRAQETARSPEPARPDAPHVVMASPVQPLPSPIMISTPRSEPADSATASLPAKSSYGSAEIDDPRRPTPPADIPSSSPVDLRAEAVLPPPRGHSNVAEDVMSAAKSVFHAVLPR